MKRLVFILSIVALLLLPFASAAEVIIDGYDYGAQTSANALQITAVHPSATAAKSSIGQSFRVNYDGSNVTVLQVWCYQASATGNVTAKIYGHSGTFGTSSLPNATTLATSNPVNVSAGAWTLTNFTFPSGLVVDAWDSYCWAIEGTTGDVSTENFAVDITAPINHRGNAFTYASSTWTVDGTQDLIFTLYGNDGTAVSWGLNGNVYITETTEVTNVTSSPTVNVTTGDVNVGGVTAEFNNTIVNATGSAITAGDVTAGDVSAAGAVTANGAITMGGDLSVNGTFDNATLTYATSTAVSGDANVYFLIAFIGLAVLLTFYNKVPLLNFLVGVIGVSFIMLTIAKTDLPFWPYSSVLLALTSLMCMISGGFKMRDN